jgi:hypothetical protein
MKNFNLIFVTGAARSGTSLVAGTLYHAGARGFSKRAPPNDMFLNGSIDNKKGFYKNMGLINTLAYPIDLYGMRDSFGKAATRQDTLNTLNSIAEYSEMKGKTPFFLKHPAFLAFKQKPYWPLWDEFFPHAKWVIVRRNGQDIQKSQDETYGKNRTDDEYFTKHVLTEIPRLKAHFDNAGQHDKYYEIWPFEAMQHRELRIFKDMLDWAGLEWNSHTEEFIAPELCHHHTANKEFPAQHLA